MSTAVIQLDFTLDFNWRTFLQPHENTCSRWYSPTTGRFLQSDPDPGKIGDPLSFNSKYIYVQNNPLLYTDPTGNGILEVFGAVLTAFVSIVSGIWVGQLFAGLGAFFGGIIGGLAGSVVGSQLGGAIMGLAYQGEGRNYGDGQKIGMSIGGFFGGFFGGMAGSGQITVDDFWDSIRASSPTRSPAGGPFSADESAYHSLAKEASKTGLTPENAQYMKSWGKELGRTFRYDLGHSSGYWLRPHYHIEGFHIPALPSNGGNPNFPRGL